LALLGTVNWVKKKVIGERFDNEKDIRRFLFGEMTADERAAFEEKFIGGETGLFEEIGVVEDELIEAYIRGTLSAGDRQKFEQHFPTTEIRRERIAFTREMLAKLAVEKESVAGKTEPVAARPAVWNSLVDLFKKPRFAFGAGVAVLVSVLGLWLLVFRSPEKENEIVREFPPTPVVSQTPQRNENTQNSAVSNTNSANLPESNKPPSNLNAGNSGKDRPPETVPKTTVATITLFAGTVRAEGQMRALDLTKDTKGAHFRLNLESQDYLTYRAALVDADGRVIYRSGKLAARNSKINVFFPTAKLKKGDYFVKLYGFNAAGEEESAADFQFRVTQK
jgi:hypothetical protein